MPACSQSVNSEVSVLFSRSSSDLADSRPCTVVNANYAKVISVLDKLLIEERFKNACRCERCVGDMAAFALNCLPPHYFVDPGRGGEIGSPAVLVEGAVIDAMKKVISNPSHQNLKLQG